MKTAILSDLHGNLSAFKAVIERLNGINHVVLLGDIIDYCPHPNEVIDLLKAQKWTVHCSIWGNHEQMILQRDYSTFLLSRGILSAKYTDRILSDRSRQYLHSSMIHSGKYEFEMGGKKCLAVHGSLQNPFWKELAYTDDLSAYEKYDYVFSGHSHIPHVFEKYYPTDNPLTRNHKKTIFINPGSIGQPRNLSTMSQFAVLDSASEEVVLMKVPYDIESEQRAFSEEVDVFYRERLSRGI